MVEKLDSEYNYSLRFFIGSLGLIILMVAFLVQSRLYDICPGYAACPTPNGSGSPLYDPVRLMNFLIIPLAEGLTVAGFLYAVTTWRVREREWAATFGAQPLARRLQYLHSQGKITREQVNEIINSLTR